MEKFRFDAFLSYAHEDEARVLWLARFLRRYWIPFRRRRRIFVDREHLSAGPLPKELKDNLRASRFLIVCCSRDARTSTWVGEEIEDFVAARSPDFVLACRVGESGDDAIPPKLELLELYIPDLRSDSVKNRIVPAAALLAPLVALKDAQQVLARRSRLLTTIAAFALFCVVAAAGRTVWLRTTAGAQHAILQRVLDAAGSEPVLNPIIGRTAEAVAVTEDKNAVRRLALFVPPDTQPAILAAGYLSLPKPDCAAAVRELRHLTPQGSTSPKGAIINRALLLGQARCGGTWVESARRHSLMNAHWAMELGEAGLAKELRADERHVWVFGWIDGEIALGITTKKPIVIPFEAITKWKADSDFDDMTSLFIRRIAVADRLNDPAAEYYANLSRKRGPWLHAGMLAALFAERGNVAEARRYLPEIDGSMRIDAWAWRAIALDRLGDREGAQAALARMLAEPSEKQPTVPQTWSDAAYAQARLGNWREAQLLAESAPTEELRILTLCSLLQVRAYGHPAAP